MSSVGGSPIDATLRTPPIRGVSSAAPPTDGARKVVTRRAVARRTPCTSMSGSPGEKGSFVRSVDERQSGRFPRFTVGGYTRGMPRADWRARAGTVFTTEKRPAGGSRGMVVTNHPLATAAGAEMLALGGNAVDAAIAALFALGVVEPMMVSPPGAGHAWLRRGHDRRGVTDNSTTRPAAAARPDVYRPVSDHWPHYMETDGRQNRIGVRAVGVPGTLKGWCEMLGRFGTLSLDRVLEPAIRHAERGFRVTSYLAECVTEASADLALFPESARTFLPGGRPLRAGDPLVPLDHAASLRTIADEGPAALYGGSLGKRVAEYMAREGGLITLEDLSSYRTVERSPVTGPYRGLDVMGAAPPTGGGIHLIQLLNIVEGYDVAALGFGTADGIHLIAEALKIAFADRSAATGDPAFVDVPVAQLLSKDYAAARRGAIDLARAGVQLAGVPLSASHTTHVTVADGDGN